MALKWALRIGRLRVPFWVWGPIALGVLALGGYHLVWVPIEHHYFPRNWGVVEEGRIYRSGVLVPHVARETLAGHRIRVLLSMEQYDPGDPTQANQKQVAEELGIEIVRIPMQGNGIPSDANETDGLRKYARAVQTIVKARAENKPILVQCGSGTHRTGGVIAVYRVLVERRPPSQAYAELCEYGWELRKHRVLLEYLNRNMAALARMLVEMKAIDPGAPGPDPVPVLGP